MKYLPLISAGMLCLSITSLAIASHFQARLVELQKERIKELEKPQAAFTVIQDWLNSGFTIRATEPGKVVLSGESISGITIDGNYAIPTQNAGKDAQ